MRVLHIAPIADQRWVLTDDEDGNPPISEHASRGEAETAARSYALTFDYPEVIVHHEDGDQSTMIIDPEEPPLFPGRPPGAP